MDFLILFLQTPGFKERAVAEAVGPGAHRDGRVSSPLQSVVICDGQNACGAEFFFFTVSFGFSFPISFQKCPILIFIFKASLSRRINGWLWNMGHLPTKVVLFRKSENFVLPDFERIKKLWVCLLGESINMIQKLGKLYWTVVRKEDINEP